MVEAFFDRQGQWQMQPANWRSDPQKAHELNEFIYHFYRRLAQLPKRNADAFVYREIDGMSTEDICRLLDISTIVPCFTANCGCCAMQAVWMT